jgi:hypothetical protein
MLSGVPSVPDSFDKPAVLAHEAPLTAAAAALAPSHRPHP